MILNTGSREHSMGMVSIGRQVRHYEIGRIRLKGAEDLNQQWCNESTGMRADR